MPSSSTPRASPLTQRAADIPASCGGKDSGEYQRDHAADSRDERSGGASEPDQKDHVTRPIQRRVELFQAPQCGGASGGRKRDRQGDGYCSGDCCGMRQFVGQRAERHASQCPWTSQQYRRKGDSGGQPHRAHVDLRKHPDSGELRQQEVAGCYHQNARGVRKPDQRPAGGRRCASFRGGEGSSIHGAWLRVPRPLPVTAQAGRRPISAGLAPEIGDRPPQTHKPRRK